MKATDLAGYLASLLVFSTFYMRRMIPLRLVAIASNLAFLLYAWLNDLTPILVLHGALLVLNTPPSGRVAPADRPRRAGLERRLLDRVILPLMQRREIDAADILFRANDPATALYYVLEGTVHLTELDKDLGPGSLVGEFALFSESGRRTATAVAKTDCVVMAPDQDGGAVGAGPASIARRPSLKMITVRMLENALARKVLPGRRHADDRARVSRTIA